MGLAGPVCLIHGAPPAKARSEDGVALQLARRNRHMDVVVTGLGATARVGTQSIEGAMWTGRLSGVSDAVLSSGARRMSIPGLGWASIEPVPFGRGFQLIVKGPFGSTLPAPKISSNGADLTLRFMGVLTETSSRQLSRLDLRRPGRVPQSSFVPLLRPRAVAPPLGDMAVGTMVLQNRSYVNVSGPPVTLSLDGASAKNVLKLVARMGGYGFVFVGAEGALQDVEDLTLAFANEPYARALNTVLLASGLQAKLDGSTLMIGKKVSGKTFGPQMSKVYRMNQASASSAADYLASLGAEINQVIIAGVASSDESGSGSSTDTQAEAIFSDVETYGASTGPLRGLIGTTDSRLGTVTLVGDSQLITVAEGYLKQIDLRKRQVAVKVQILSVNLANDKSIDASFSSLIGDKFIVSEGGNAFINFGKNKPGSSVGTGTYPGEESSGEESSGEESSGGGSSGGGSSGGGFLQPGTYASGKDEAEGYRQPNGSFYAYLNSVIVSTAAKTLAQPTLLVQEGEEAMIETGESVIIGVTKTTVEGVTDLKNERTNAGLILKVKVSKIDDNGFVTMNVNPEINVPIPSGTQQGVSIFSVDTRRLASGSIRLRDRQTLILTGVIQDSDRRQARKWPILGDMPLIGQLFRSNSSSRGKTELVIIVTPSVINDQDNSTYGYGYLPSSREARKLMKSS